MLSKLAVMWSHIHITTEMNFGCLNRVNLKRLTAYLESCASNDSNEINDDNSQFIWLLIVTFINA